MTKRKNRPPKSQQAPPPSQKAERTVATAVAQYSGPIPPPNILAGYEEIQPGFADRIVTMAELEVSHRHEMEQRALDSEIETVQQEQKEIRRGQVFAFILGLVTIIAGAGAAIMGAQIAGSLIGISVYLWQKRKNRARQIMSGTPFYTKHQCLL